MIAVVGLGLGDNQTLSNNAQQAINKATVVMGSKRQLLLVENLLNPKQLRLPYPRPLSNLKKQLLNYLLENPNNNICLLASGDPLFYGISDFLLRHFSVQQLHFYSNISSIQVAFARIKKSWQNAKVISLHGRPITNLIPYLANQSLIAVLTDQYSHPQAIAKILCEYGYTGAKLSICEALGTENERIVSVIAHHLLSSTEKFHPLHITIIELENSHCNLPSFPGFDDKLFITDSKEAGKGMISKREIRLMALSLLAPKPYQIAWDIGAGCGSIAIEWAYWNQQGKIYAIEHHPKRLDCLKKNKRKFGVNNLQIIRNKAPAGLENLPQPHAIFIGGTAGKLTSIMDYCWEKLTATGCLVINCVTEDCKTELQYWLQQQNINNNKINWTEIAISKGEQLAGQLLMRPRLPVRLLKIIK